ncbi:hypothetical protein DY000_02022823 [Brassica cretica]|uniref:Uncharacterized protein n=1 Tax=Brassica cretica TaxID=69181 RepID=A0ABQ7EJ13_BRACR|nr:hypothetical protein DY000_02022823 [Brassica cretica]
MQGFSDKYLELQEKLVPNFSLSNFSLESKSASIAGSVTTGSVTKIGQASKNQDLMVVATKPCSLLFDLYPRILCEASLEDCRLEVPFEFFYWNLYESSLNGFSHQVMFRLLLTRS